jgi:hypothetical protein
MGSDNQTPLVERHQARADQVVATARRHAEEIRAIAEEEAERVLAEAEREAARRLEEQAASPQNCGSLRSTKRSAYCSKLRVRQPDNETSGSSQIDATGRASPSTSVRLKSRWTPLQLP